MSEQLNVIIDRSSPVPLYHQLAGQLSAAINQGLLQPGDPFENELSMAERLDLSRPTVRRAIAELVDKGLLVRRRGIGTTVASKAIHRQAELTSLHDDLLKSGRTPVTEVLDFIASVTETRAAEAMGLPEEAQLTYVERLRSADGTPIAILRNWLPVTLPGLSVEALQRDGLYEVLRRGGIRPAVAHQTISARRPNSRERRLLDLRAGDPLLTMSRVAFDASGNPVEYGDHCYSCDHYYFDFTVYNR